MWKPIYFLLFTCLLSCNTGKLSIVTDLPNTLNEVSGNEITKQSDLIWMLNDHSNSSKLYGVDKHGNIIKKLKIHAKNNDWEDITSDNEGNLYIGDFGNNHNKRKNLAVLKVNKNALNNSNKINIERISFKFPNQTKFPPKKKHMFFDCEAFFWYNDSLFLFTKSRVHNDYGRTTLYKIPAKKGKYTAQVVATFNTCSSMDCWITSADISNDGKKMVLLTSKSVWLFTDFSGSNFFNGKSTELPFNHISQKEGICFKNDSTLYITDEKAHGSDGFLYKFKLN